MISPEGLDEAIDILLKLSAVGEEGGETEEDETDEGAFVVEADDDGLGGELDDDDGEEAEGGDGEEEDADFAGHTDDVLLEGSVAVGEPGLAGGGFENEVNVAEDHRHKGEDGDATEAEEGDGGVVGGDFGGVFGGVELLGDGGVEAVARDDGFVVGGCVKEVAEALGVGDGDESSEDCETGENPVDDFGDLREDEGEFEEEGWLLGRCSSGF